MLFRSSGRNTETHAWNLGEKVGLSGLDSLGPLLGVWALFVADRTLARRRR